MTLRSSMLSSAAALAILFTAGVNAQAQQPRAFEPDARTALAGGLHDAEQAAWNLQLEHAITPPPGFFDPDALFNPRAFRAAMEAAAAAEANGEEAVQTRLFPAGFVQYRSGLHRRQGDCGQLQRLQHL
jgi:hypothetical protein